MTVQDRDRDVALHLSGQDADDAPASLHRVMQTMIADGLKARYEPPQKLSHGLLVLLMQLHEIDRKKAAQKPRVMTT